MAEFESPYPDGCRGAVSLTFDDGRESQLDFAVPALNERGLLSTFYLVPSDSLPGAGDWADRLVRWKDVVRQGHEAGNHSLTHTCSLAFCDSYVARRLEELTLDDIEADALEAEHRLTEVLGPADRSFCYPCYNAHVGEGLTRQSYVPVIAKHFAAARARGEYANYPLTCSLTYLWSYPAEEMTGQRMIGLIERAVANGQWCMLAFHTIGAGHLPVTKAAFLQVCDYLAQNRAGIWVAPVIDIARRIADWRKQSK